MPSRDFICTPSEWTDDPTLNGLTDDAELLFRRLASCTDGKWRFPIDPSHEAHSIRTAVFRPQRRFRAWNPDRVHRSLTELTQAGMLIRHCHDDRHWLEVAPRWRYEKGRDPITGESTSLPPIAPELPLGDAATPPRPGGRNGKRKESESKKSKADESPPSAPPGTRAKVREEDSHSPERFARGPDAFPGDDLWCDLCETLGDEEMQAKGAIWETRFRTNRGAIARCLEDYKVKTTDARGQIGNIGAYLTQRYTAHTILTTAA